MGGAVTAFRHKGADGRREPIFRDTPSGTADAVDASAFSLVPFCNRVRDGRFTFRDVEVSLTPNLVGDASPLHGQGWRAAWTATQIGATAAELSFTHAAGEWPWRYEARQTFELDAGGLVYGLALRNLSDTPMPAGLGLHPYFPCNTETVLDTVVESVWSVDSKVLPVAQEAPTGRYDLHERLIDGADLDNGYGGWGGEAVMLWPDRGLKLRMRSTGVRFFQVYAPKTGGVFVAEPVTHANAALNEPEAGWRDLGLKVLIPGEEMRLDVRLDVSREA